MSYALAGGCVVHHYRQDTQHLENPGAWPMVLKTIGRSG